jgi:hypothetical protein
MDRQLQSPLLITTIDKPKRLKPADVYTTLSGFIEDLPWSPARTQLERLNDAIGVEIGRIQPSEGEAREKKRREEKLAARAERRRAREAEAAANEQDDIAAQVEALGEDEDEGEMEEGAVGFEGEEGMEDRGDVEYGDAEVDEDEDEPDNADAKLTMDTEEWQVLRSIKVHPCS